MKIIFDYHKLRNDFSLGIQLCSQYQEKLAEGETFETLGTDHPIRMIPLREYYTLLGLGFGTLAIGFTVEGRKEIIR